CQCNLTVNSFTGDKTSFNPGAGQTLNFSMAFTETYNNPVTWTITVGGKSFSNSDPSPPVWDGTGADGRVVQPGTYPATLTASVNGGCSQTMNINVDVIESGSGQCPITGKIGP
ncbi:hypothetical protein, partial [Geobacter sp. AOG1]|uniref:hypothetical protein n=1 Tax=Geobacter sp. AOG1 TaxID=1566346 RepID=UPI001CC41C81